VYIRALHPFHRITHPYHWHRHHRRPRTVVRTVYRTQPSYHYQYWYGDPAPAPFGPVVVQHRMPTWVKVLFWVFFGPSIVGVALAIVVSFAVVGAVVYLAVRLTNALVRRLRT
jgi:hypothetical protein